MQAVVPPSLYFSLLQICCLLPYLRLTVCLLPLSLVQVTVDRPDVQGRVAILKVHSRGKALGKDVDLEKIARRTPGFTGEHLESSWIRSGV